MYTEIQWLAGQIFKGKLLVTDKNGWTIEKIVEE